MLQQEVPLVEECKGLGLRVILSHAATVSFKKRVVMLNDIGRAFFHAPASRLLFIELSEEDRGTKDVIEMLQMSLYGTRDA